MPKMGDLKMKLPRSPQLLAALDFRLDDVCSKKSSKKKVAAHKARGDDEANRHSVQAICAQDEDEYPRYICRSSTTVMKPKDVGLPHSGSMIWAKTCHDGAGGQAYAGFQQVQRGPLTGSTEAQSSRAPSAKVNKIRIQRRQADRDEKIMFEFKSLDTEDSSPSIREAN